MRRVAALALLAVAAASAAAGDEPAPEAVLAELPFLGDNEGDTGAVRVDLGPEGGRQLPLLLDTASPQSFATPVAAQSLGIRVRRSKQTPYRRATRLGRDVAIVVDTRRSDTAASAGGEWAVLGGSFLSAYVVEIDLPGRRVRFLDPDRYAVPERSELPNASVLPFRLAANRPVVEIQVGSSRVPAVLATGAPGTLLLPGGFAAETSLAHDPNVLAEIAPLPGAGRLEPMLAERVRIGRFIQPQVPILVAERGANGAGPRSDAILGTGLLTRFVLRIDYPRRRLWIATPER